MSGWDIYDDRMSVIGTTKREALLNHARGAMYQRMMDSPACHMVKVNGNDQFIMVSHSSELNEKKITSLPGETLIHGGIVEYADNHWLISELDAASGELYTRGKMLQCNHILRWINKDGVLIEKWCYVQDGTKYLIGEHLEQFMTTGDSRIAVTVPKDDDTIYLDRGMRFLIDDVDSDTPIAYRITKSNKLYNNFNDAGIFRFILNECNLEEADNRELRIADYSNWLPEKPVDSKHVDSTETVVEIVTAAKAAVQTAPSDGKKGWL